MNQVPTGENRCVEYCLINRAFDGMSTGLVIVDTAGRFSWANRAALSVLGTRLGAAEGQPLSSVLRDPQLSTFWHEAADATEGRTGDVFVRWPRAAQLKANVTQCFDRSGERIGCVLLLCDVTAEGTVQLDPSQEAAERLPRTPGLEEGDAPGTAASLTPQEVRVLRLVGQGLSNDDIARRMFVAPSTVRSHLKHVYRKTGLKSRSEAVRYANRNGFD